MPEVSLVVPVYNVAPYLIPCLESVSAQRFGDFEALLVDDGSTDDSPAILRRFAERDGRFRVIRRENGGLSAARNTGVAAARGKYLAFLDGDDRLRPDFLARLVEKAEGDGLDLVLCGFAYLYPDGRRVPAPARHRLSGEPAREYLLSEPMAPVRLFRRELFAGLSFKEGTLYEDLELTPFFAAETEKIGFVDEALYDYLQRPGSIMRKGTDPRRTDIFSVLDSLSARFEAAGKAEEFAREIEFLYIEHLLRSAALRFAAAPDGKTLFPRLKEAVEARFPRWRENPYRRKMPLSFRLITGLAGSGRRGAVAALARLRERRAG